VGKETILKGPKRHIFWGDRTLGKDGGYTAKEPGKQTGTNLDSACSTIGQVTLCSQEGGGGKTPCNSSAGCRDGGLSSESCEKVRKSRRGARKMGGTLRWKKPRVK